MRAQVLIDFDNIMEWMARIVIQENESYTLSSQNPSHNTTPVPFDPSGAGIDSKRASFLITMARFLAERSDDPKTGVGAETQR